jgi:1,4-alpha-glucan branching enzyme
MWLSFLLACASLPRSIKDHEFKVWAPNAICVAVHPAGPAAAWGATALSRDDQGTWAAKVAGVVPGDGYVFRINNQSSRIDPRCTDVWHTGREISINSSWSVIPPKYTFRNEKVIIQREMAIFYELFVGQFTAEGTFDAAIGKLGYLSALGVNVIELMPVMHSCSGSRDWGYCPRAPFAVRPELGGSLGLKRFVDAAADFGMAVALDVVFNHAAGDSLLLDYDLSGRGGGIFFYEDDFALTPWGPRPSYRNDKAGRQFIVDNVAMLVEDFHIRFALRLLLLIDGL